MKEEEIKEWLAKGGDIDITINGNTEKHTLPDDMSVEKFKSYILS
jgi:hypothetical protein